MPFPLAQFELSPQGIWIFGIFSLILGCCIGSFLNVVIWRMPRRESLCHPGSHCPRCNHEIRAWENIPILSWLFLRGRCSNCHLPISIRYPLGEGACGLLYVLVYYSVVKRGESLLLLPGYFWLTGSLLAASWIDVKHRILPNPINFTGMIVGLVLSLVICMLPESAEAVNTYFKNIMNCVLPGKEVIFLLRMAPFLNSVAGLTVGWLGLALLTWALNHSVGLFLNRGQKPGSISLLGAGDAKLLGMIGAFLGLEAVVYTLLWGALLGLTWAILLLPIRRQMPFSVPFGPFLSLAALGWMVWPALIHFQL